MMKLFVVGARSPTGKALAEILRKGGLPFFAPAEKHCTADNAATLAAMVKEFQPSQLVNLADFISGNHGALKRAELMAKRCRSINAELPGVLAEICHDANLPLLHLSTSYVFNGAKRLAYSEDDDPAPGGVYGESSLAGERRVSELAEHVVLRPGWLFGPHKCGLIKSWIRGVKRYQGEIEVWRRRLSPTSTEDLAAAIFAICQQVDCQASVWGTYHYVGLTPAWEKEFAMLALEYAASHDEQIYQLLGQVQLNEKPPRAPEIFNSTLSGKKLFDSFGIKARNWQKQLRQTVRDLYDPTKRAAA